MKSAIIWVDEAGRWAWAWPVVAACVFWQWRCPIRGILWDSKKISPIQREKTYHEIISLAAQWKLFYGVWIIANTIIDSVGIREANRLAMEGALSIMTNDEWIMNNERIRLFIDGRDKYQFDIQWLPVPEYIVRGDSKIKQIMAASILAKVTRDHLMQDFEIPFPGYGFGSHKWYGTQFHQRALQKLGICEIHRRSYKPILFK